MGQREDRQRAEFEAWLADRPPRVRAVAEQYTPNVCYLGPEGHARRGHYLIYCYDEPDDGGSVTVKVDHLDDSFLPGVRVFGVDPATLTVCGCMRAW